MYAYLSCSIQANDLGKEFKETTVIVRFYDHRVVQKSLQAVTRAKGQKSAVQKCVNLLNPLRTKIPAVKKRWGKKESGANGK